MGSIGVNGEAYSAIITPEQFAQQEFDFVICGGGTAGLCIAARLSEDPNVTVGVIEAGKNWLNDTLVDTPGLFFNMFGKSDYDWCYYTTPQRGNMKEKVHNMPRGKLLGGSSGINYMMYVRGSSADYDDWASITGDQGWSSDNMEHYMRKHQMLEPIGEKVVDRFTMPFVAENHGTSGPIHTSFNEWKHPLEDSVVKAADYACGFTVKPTDPWSGDHIGFYHTLAAISRSGPTKGKRSYAARGYFEEHKHRPNLKVVTESLVTRIILQGDTATGVAYRSGGQDFTVGAKREVIVCGGAINSPQILELSGIGDPEILRTVGVVSKIENRAVGNNFQDHFIAGMSFETNGIPTLDSATLPEMAEAAMKEFQEEQSGPLTTTQTVQGYFPFSQFASTQELRETIDSIASIKDQTPFAKKQRDTVIAHLKDPKSADLQLVFIPATFNFESGHSDQSKFFPRLTDPNADMSEPNGVSFAIGVNYPTSRGSVHIKSNDPEVHPDIDPAYLAHESDLAVCAAGMRFLDAMSKAPALNGILGRRLHPNPERDLTTIEGSRAAVMDWIMGEYHPCGSVAMGDALDSRLKVKGTKNIRVADASSFPGHVSGNIMSSVYALAERAADIIKEDNNLVASRK